ncbi:M20 family metallopeptidase [Streptomyces sp. NPDC002499]
MTSARTPEPVDTDRTLARLAQLVGIETPSGHVPGLEACYDLLTAWAPAALGTPRRYVNDGVPHLYWRREPAGPTPSGVLLLGHADTVWPLGTLDSRPFRHDGDRLTGPGVFDMKAGLVIALDALDLSHPAGHVSLLVTGDEETGSLGSRALIEEAAREHAAVLVLEPSDGDAVKTARKGAGIFRLSVKGRAAHAGLEPETGVNALVELAHQVLAVNRLGDPRAGTTVSPTVARAGTTTNSVPESARLDIDVRAWTLDELDRVEGELRGLAALLPEAGLDLTGGINRPPLERTMSAALLTKAQQVARAHELGDLREVAVGGASDGNFTAAAGTPTLDGLGARGGGAHARHEWVETRSLAERALLLAGLLDALRP